MIETISQGHDLSGAIDHPEDKIMTQETKDQEIMIDLIMIEEIIDKEIIMISHPTIMIKKNLVREKIVYLEIKKSYKIQQVPK